MPINTPMFLAFLQIACYVSSLGEDGTSDCWGVPTSSKKVALAACSLNPYPTDRRDTAAGSWPADPAVKLLTCQLLLVENSICRFTGSDV